MAKVTNCVRIQCDRCGHSDVYESDFIATNIGWMLELKIPDERPVDLCPKCYGKWLDMLGVFLYGNTEEKEETV